MSGPQTVITNPKVATGAKESTKSFNFDFSYWSHDVRTQTFDFTKKINFQKLLIFFLLVSRSEF